MLNKPEDQQMNLVSSWSIGSSDNSFFKLLINQSNQSNNHDSHFKFGMAIGVAGTAISTAGAYHGNVPLAVLGGVIALGGYIYAYGHMDN